VQERVSVTIVIVIIATTPIALLLFAANHPSALNQRMSRCLVAVTRRGDSPEVAWRVASLVTAGNGYEFTAQETRA
jgi:hypothetical protein